MKALAVVFSLAFTTSVFAQTSRNFGSVVFPGGTSLTTPGITRNFGSTVFPGGAPVPTVRGGALPVGVGHAPGVFNPITVPSRNGQGFRGGGIRNNNNRGQQPYVYAYPVYIGGNYDPGAYDNGYAGPDPGMQQPPPQAPPQNITVVYPPNQRANPVMIQAGPDGQYYTSGQRQGAVIYDAARPPAPPQDQPEPGADAPRYLIAFRDHTIYSAVAYWADGDTLHYFTTGQYPQSGFGLADRSRFDRTPEQGNGNRF